VKLAFVKTKIVSLKSLLKIATNIVIQTGLEREKMPCQKIYWVPKHAMGRVIGKGGRMIQALSTPNSCELDFRRSLENKNGETPLTITSPSHNMEAVEAVYEEVEKIVRILNTL